MAYYINDDCISCGACEPECPNQAIRPGDTVYIIDPQKCNECVGAFTSSRCAAVCPVDAPHPDLKILKRKLSFWISGAGYIPVKNLPKGPTDL